MNMKIYDKAKWHSNDIDRPEDTNHKIKHLKVVINWLHENNLLTEEGLEIHELGVDQEFSLTSEMVAPRGKELLDEYYEEWINNLSYDEEITSAFWDEKL